MTNWRKWTKQEDDYLKENYGKITAQKIAKKLKRTPSSVRAKANELNLKSNIPNSKETHRKIALNFTKQLKNTAFLPSKELAYIIGVLNGDGYLTNDDNYVLGMGTIDYDFALNFKNIVEKWSKLNVQLYKEKYKTYRKGILYRNVLNSKKVSQFLINFYVSRNKKEAIINIKKMLNHNKNLEIEFIKGFFDSEGSIAVNGRIGIYNKNKDLINFCKELFTKLKIKTKIYNKKIRKSTDFYTLYIQSKEDIIKFQKLIKCSIKRKQDRIDNLINSYVYPKHLNIPVPLL